MALTHRKRRDSHDTRGKSEVEAAGLAARLAPLEEQERLSAGRSQENGGAVSADRAGLPIPQDMIEKDSAIFGLEPVVIFLLVFALCFIAFIIWQISMMPESQN